MLELKLHTQLQYLTNLASLALARVSGESIQLESPTESGTVSGSGSVVDRLVELRLTLERIRPLEARLRPQLDRLVADANVPPDAERAADAPASASRFHSCNTVVQCALF